jgi:hypothetical protein
MLHIKLERRIINLHNSVLTLETRRFLPKEHMEVGVVTHTHNSTFRRLRQKDYKLQ